MPTLEQKLNALRDAKRRLAIVGKFSAADDAAERWTFRPGAAPGDGVGPLDAPELFERLRPELRLLGDAVPLLVGNNKYQKYRLGTPLEAADAAGAQPLPLDSPLLDREIPGLDGTIPPREVQALGGELFRDLVNDLDRVAHFSRGAFTRALLELSRHYVRLAADRSLANHRVNDLEWVGLLQDDPELSTALVKYLTCHTGDEPAVRREIRGALGNAFPWVDEQHRRQRVEALVAGVERCKAVMLEGVDPASTTASADLTGVDPILQALHEEGSFSPWFEDFAGDPDRGFVVPALGATSFLEHYRAFMEASNGIHRLLRSEALHPFLFCWLASQYEDHGLTQVGQAAQEMYEVGVDSQDDRVPGLTEEQKTAVRASIREAEIRGDDDLARQAKEALANEDSYKLLMRQTSEDVEEELIRRLVFRRATLAERLVGQFVHLGLTAEGVLGDLRGQARDAVRGYVRFFDALHTAGAAPEGEARDAGFFREALEVRAQTDEHRTFVKALFDDLGEADRDLTDDDLLNRLSVLCAERLTGLSKAEATRGYLANKDQVDEQEDLLRRLYEGHLGIEFRPGKAGMTVQVVDDWVLPGLEEAGRTEVKRRRAQRVQELYRSTGGETPRVVKTPFPKTLEDWEGWADAGARGEARAEIRDEQQGRIGEIQAVGDSLEVRLDEGVDPAQLNTEGVVAHNEMGDGEIEVVRLNLPQLRDQASDVEDGKVVEALEHHAELVRYRDVMVAKYTGDDGGADGPNRTFQMALRALTLGEYLYSAPDDAVRLDEYDRSCVLGVLLDMVEHVGDRSLGAALYRPGPTENLTGLSRINLSTYFPVADGTEMENVLRYQYDLADEVLKVRDYLREVREVRDLFRAAEDSGDLEIEVINDTLAGAVTEWNNAPDSSLFSDRAVGAVYLTAQAGDPGVGLGRAAEHLFAVLRNPAAVPILQLPIFAGPVSAASSHGLPWVGPNLVRPPRLREAGSRKSGDLEVRGVVEAEPCLTLCAALLSPSIDLGTVAAAPVPVLGLVRERLGCPVAAGLPVVDLLRDAWRSHPGLASQLLLAKWLSIAILANRDDETKQFGKVLQSAFAAADWREAAFPALDGFDRVAPSLQVNRSWLDLEATGVQSTALSGTFGTEGRDGTELRPLVDVQWKDDPNWAKFF